MSSTPQYDEDKGGNWMRFTDDSTEINGELDLDEEEDDVDDLDTAQYNCPYSGL